MAMRSVFLATIAALLIGCTWTFKLNRASALSSRLIFHNNKLSSQTQNDKQLLQSLVPIKKSLALSSSTDAISEGNAWLNPNTRGGVIVWCGLLTLLPVGIYQYFISTGLEPTTVGAYVGALFVLLSNLLWASTYVFRVANKDMTYAKQLRDYENAVLQKRLEELADDEISALMEEIEIEEGSKSTSSSLSSSVSVSESSTSVSAIANDKE